MSLDATQFGYPRAFPAAHSAPESALRQPAAQPGPVFEWRPEYSVGVRALDRQHQRIFELLNSFYETMLRQQGRAALTAALDELTAYVRGHFAGEELLMETFAYPESEEHRREHARLIQVLLEFREQFADDREHLATPLLEFMDGWLVRHMLSTDRRYSAFFARRGARP